MGPWREMTEEEIDRAVIEAAEAWWVDPSDGELCASLSDAVERRHRFIAPLTSKGRKDVVGDVVEAAREVRAAQGIGTPARYHSAIEALFAALDDFDRGIGTRYQVERCEQCYRDTIHLTREPGEGDADFIAWMKKKAAESEEAKEAESEVEEPSNTETELLATRRTLNSLASLADRALVTGGEWLGDMTEQAAESSEASAFMSAMERLREAVDTVDGCRENHEWIDGECAHCHVKEDDYKAQIDRLALHGAFEEFLDQWLAEPPLVRASAGVNVWDVLQSRIRGLMNRSDRERRAGLHRRSKVSARIGIATAVMVQLFLRLTNHADNEAVEKGIDLDTRYDGNDPLDQLGIVENMQRETDQEVLEELLVPKGRS